MLRSEIEYDSRILVSDSSVSVICQDFQYIFRKSLLCFTDAAFIWIKRTSYKKAADLSTNIRQTLMNNYKPMVLMHPKKFYYSDQETPMDLAVIGYSSLSSYSL